MRKTNIAGAMLMIAVLFLSACGNFGKNADNDNRDEADIITEREKEGGSMETGDGYGFDDFDLTIEQDGEEKVDASYEVKAEDFEVDYENKIAGFDLEGQDAMNEMDKLFTSIMITKDTPEEEIIDKITDFYQLDSYSKFDLKVHFDDGTDLTINDQK